MVSRGYFLRKTTGAPLITPREILSPSGSKAHPSKITDQVRGFEDSLIVFQFYKVNPKEITDLYVDNKTRVWFAVRYKYEKVFPMIGVGYILLDWINTGEVSGETAIIGGSLVGAGILARVLISRKMKIKGRRKLEILRI
ncbi:MAG: hypothetical protein WDN75_09395 [Bacteroidota bacterium]